MKYRFTRTNKTVKLNLNKWNDILKTFLPNFNSPDVRLYLYQEKLSTLKVNNGHPIDIKVDIEYKNLSIENCIKLLTQSTDYVNNTKIKLNEENYFGYYNINVLSIILDNININPQNGDTYLKLILVSELINPDDYYGTIGAYRLVWENICVKNYKNKEGLIKLAEDLQIDHYDEDDLCEIIGEKVNNLSWEDFK